MIQNIFGTIRVLFVLWLKYGIKYKSIKPLWRLSRSIYKYEKMPEKKTGRWLPVMEPGEGETNELPRNTD